MRPMTPESVRSTDPREVIRNTICEIEFTSNTLPVDPWSEIRLDLEVTDPDGEIRVVPAFWAGGRCWRVRYSSPVEGVHRYRTKVASTHETGLEEVTGELRIVGYKGTNRLILHGPPIVAPDGRHLAHADGTPFFWLADTWWSAFTARFSWPDTFGTLVEDRVAKNFSVIQLVAGLVPEFGLFSPLMASEGGQPFDDRGKGLLNPHYYDVPDEKIDYLVGSGLVPCIVGGWGSWASVLSKEQILAHWRYIVARYAAYPVVWCIAGEVEMPLPFAPMDGETLFEDVSSLFVEPPTARMDAQVDIWKDAARLVGEIDPFQRIRTVHPCPIRAFSSTEAFGDRSLFELDMLQTGHGGYTSTNDSMEHLTASLAHGDKPVVNGECSYEGVGGGSWQDTQRFQFWSRMLSGTAGHTYGTMPISTFSSEDDPYRPPSRVNSCHWQEAINWPGSAQVGIGRKILERFRWWELRPDPDTIRPHSAPKEWFDPYAATLPDGTRIIYLPGMSAVLMKGPEMSGPVECTLLGLVPGTSYVATYIDPRSGKDEPSLKFTPQTEEYALHNLIPNGFVPAYAPTMEDWILVVRPEGPRDSTSGKPW